MKSASRTIDPKHLKRANSVPDELVGPYLDAIATSLHQALDSWRFHNGPVADVDLALDAFVALRTSAELRGLG